MTQSKLNSLLESITNVSIGTAVNWCVAFWLLPVFGYDYSVGEASELTAVFLVVSLVRLYVVRRWFCES